ncbi:MULTISPECIES: tripartite tricarboxylate transporter TctB family protein [unclassified Halanaerobium]|uniref:tripartite tricarboxylate transporter TctB family protein n=1 Tax=unclassified Halanaerobium TaxID=2641197 RepID=UPI000DF26474|nr:MULTISPECIES: tripartite tricarboxylate transporter TctB family protein [unclassified Halanaerobium]RCW41995.1 tripartite tricarboxylate transporter TctB family protein [Halanaerobium sp. MA284_MarDTE_T2]RCW79956.1 tripartite tricarboxylate transporter TctB family protein [Halanaerobium sp. DL-01]
MKKNPTFITAVIMILIATLLFISTYSIQVSGEQGNRLGPRFFPRLMLGLIIFFNLVLAYQSYRYPEEQKKVKPIPKDKQNRFIGTAVLGVLTGFSFNYLGGFTAIFLFVLLFLIIWNQKRIKVLVLTPILVTAGAYLLFHELLSVRMPKGIIDALFL